MHTPPQPPITNSYYQQPQQQQHTPIPQQPPTTRPTFRRRGSVESLASIMTETSSQTRRHTVTKAVLSCESGPYVDNIVDMLLTLKKKDLATCLFNKVFLKSKIRQAKDALDIFQKEQKQQRDMAVVPQVVAQASTAKASNGYGYYNGSRKEITAALEQVVPIQTRYNPISLPPRSNRAIPIVAPPLPPPPPPIQQPSMPTVQKSCNISPATTTQQQLLDPIVLSNDKEPGEEIEKFLTTLNGLIALHEKKQLLGDRLFPLVKVKNNYCLAF
jgi:hypothetical protein